MSFLKRLFSKKSKKPKKEPESSIVKKDEKSNVWIIESIIQLTRSRQWRRDIRNFTESNCLTFENKEENSHDHYKIYNDFIQLVEKKLETFIVEIGLTEQEFYMGVQLAYQMKAYSNFVEQLLSLEDFELFKRMMIKTNKKLEYEARKYYGEKTDVYEKEKAEIEYAIELSAKMHEEYEKQLKTEDEELQKAIMESKVAYERQKSKKEEKEKKAEKKKEEKKVEKVEKIEKEPVKKVEEKKIKNDFGKVKNDIEERMKQEKLNLQKRLMDLEILRKNHIKIEEDEAKERKTDKETTANEQKEGLEERRKRLQKQRDMFLKIKREREEKENDTGDLGVDYKDGGKDISMKEKQGRKEIYDRVLKG